MVRVAPFIVESRCNCMSTFGHEEKEHIKQYHVPITYWGIYLDDKFIYYTSSEETAEKTKIWLEKWLKN